MASTYCPSSACWKEQFSSMFCITKQDSDYKVSLKPPFPQLRYQFQFPSSGTPAPRPGLSRALCLDGNVLCLCWHCAGHQTRGHWTLEMWLAFLIKLNQIYMGDGYCTGQCRSRFWKFSPQTPQLEWQWNTVPRTDIWDAVKYRIWLDHDSWPKYWKLTKLKILLAS